AVWRRAREEGVVGLHVPGVWPDVDFSSRRGDGVGFGLGLHPWWLAKYPPSSWSEALIRLREARVRGAEAIGECGLDKPLSKRRGGPSLDAQVEVLEGALGVAADLALPLVMHVVGAHGRALEVLQRHRPAAVLLHSYSGPPDLVPRYAELNCVFSFSGAFLRPRAKRAQASLAAVPASHLLLESDGPDQKVGDKSRGEPVDLVAIAAGAARVRCESLEAVASATFANAMRFFRREF
ncbi:MAG: TatD family hydrolase, partial [Myxococcota bacterium]